MPPTHPEPIPLAEHKAVEPETPPPKNDSDSEGEPDVLPSLNEMESWSTHQRDSFIESVSISQLVHLVRTFREKKWKHPNVTLTFRNVSTWQKKEGGSTLNVLSNVSGYVKPGQLLCVLGQGGTSLVDALGKRSSPQVTTGEILIDGRHADEDYHNIVGVVSHMDTHHPTLTVRETVLYSMRNRVHEGVIPDSLKELMADALIKILG